MLNRFWQLKKIRNVTPNIAQTTQNCCYKIYVYQSVQSLSRVSLFVTPWIAARQASLSCHQLSEITQTHVHRVSDAIQPSHPPSSPSPLPPIPPSIRVFSNESALCMRWPKYWSFRFSIIPSKEIPGLISFRMDWLDLLAVQGLSRVFSNTTVQKHQFFGAQPSSQSNSHIHTWLLEKP